MDREARGGADAPSSDALRGRREGPPDDELLVGAHAGDGREPRLRLQSGGAFPDAPYVAGFSEKRLRGEIRCGYRAGYLLSFSEAVASGRLDLLRWEESDRPDEEVESEIAAQPGFGPYAVQTLSRLLGRHAKLGLDSWSRQKVAALRFRGRRVPDARVERFYRPFGRWAGLAFWLDVTQEWHDRTEKLWP